MTATSRGRLLRDESESGHLRIAIPEVALLEAEANHHRAVSAAESKLKAARESLEQRRAPQGGDLKPRQLTYRADLEEVLRVAGGEILPIPQVPHDQLVEEAVWRRRPFDAKGDGYRDALPDQRKQRAFAD
jgi:hypothetical protein